MSKAIEGIERYMVENADTIRDNDNSLKAVTGRFKFWGDLVHDAPLLLAVAKAAAEFEAWAWGKPNPETYATVSRKLGEALAVLESQWSGASREGQGDE